MLRETIPSMGPIWYEKFSMQELNLSREVDLHCIRSNQVDIDCSAHNLVPTDFGEQLKTTLDISCVFCYFKDPVKSNQYKGPTIKNLNEIPKLANGWIGVRSPIQNNVLKSCEMLSCEQVKNLKLKVNTGYCVNPSNYLSLVKLWNAVVSLMFQL